MELKATALPTEPQPLLLYNLFMPSAPVCRRLSHLPTAPLILTHAVYLSVGMDSFVGRFAVASSASF